MVYAYPKPIRLAIFEADNPLPSTCAEYGSYGGVFLSLFHKAADSLGVPREDLEITGWNVVNMEAGEQGEMEEMGGKYRWKRRVGLPNLEEVDAVLITGSRFNAFDNDPWVLRLVEFTKEILVQRRVRIIGVCYGHQIIGRALGAKVARKESGIWEVSVCQVEQTERGRDLFAEKTRLNIFQMHKDVIYAYPQGVEALGSSPECAVQGMYIPRRLVTVQGHPEFTEDIVRELLAVRMAQGVFSEDVFKDSMKRVGDEQDGVPVAIGFLRFLME